MTYSQRVTLLVLALCLPLVALLLAGAFLAGRATPGASAQSSAGAPLRIADVLAEFRAHNLRVDAPFAFSDPLPQGAGDRYKVLDRGWIVLVEYPSQQQALAAAAPFSNGTQRFAFVERNILLDCARNDEAACQWYAMVLTAMP